MWLGDAGMQPWVPSLLENHILGQLLKYPKWRLRAFSCRNTELTQRASSRGIKSSVSFSQIPADDTAKVRFLWKTTRLISNFCRSCILKCSALILQCTNQHGEYCLKWHAAILHSVEVTRFIFNDHFFWLFYYFFLTANCKQRVKTAQTTFYQI